MSFKIFTLQLTGKIKPVATIEKQRQDLADDYAEFLKVESSDELKAFKELEALVQSESFKRKKKETEQLQFKGSKEEKQEREFLRLKKTAKIRKYFKLLQSAELTRFENQFEGEKLQNYRTLLEFIKGGQFAKEKKKIQAQVFRGSPEEKQLVEFKRLEKSAAMRAFKELDNSEQLKKHDDFAGSEKLKRFKELKAKSSLDKETKIELKNLKRDAQLKAFFRLEKSKKYRLYTEMHNSQKLERYEELKKVTSTEEFKKQEGFLKDKKKFEKSEAYAKEQEFKVLAADEDIKFVLKFEKSGLYKNYLAVKDSSDLQRFNELQVIIDSEEFKKQKAWLEDKKRWEKTDDFKKFSEYQQQKQKASIVLFEKYKDSSDFDFFKQWELKFDDSFNGKSLDAEKWGTATHTAEKLIGENYAMPGDLNIFTNGENLQVHNKLSILVKNEKAKGKVWKMPAGFVPTDFDFTSGMINSGGKFEMEDGIVEAKIKFNPVKQVASAFYLSGDKNNPRLNLMEMGPKNYLGISTLNGKGKIENSGLDISNLKKDDYIFTLEKQGANFTWKINNVLVWQQNDSSLNTPLQLNASSLVIDKISGGNSFDIEWVKCYQKK